MREPPSEGVFGAGTLGYIRFFWPSHQVGLEDFLVEVVLPAFFVTLQFHAVSAFYLSLLDLLVFSADLLPGALGEVGLDESKISAVQLDQLFRWRSTSSNLSESWAVQGQLMKQAGCGVRRMRCTRILPTRAKRVSDYIM